MNRISIAVGAGLLAASATIPAFAQSSPENIVVHVSVPHSDLDLTSDAGARIMLMRLDKAATRACGGKPVAVTAMDPFGQVKKQEHRRCKAAAMDASTSRLGAPLVRAAWLHQQAGPSGRQASRIAAGAR